MSDGFTLVEVLMAAFVLGLGVLGLAAMFAGAARQQQLASQVTRSVSITQSADAMLGEQVGPLGIDNCGTNLEDVNLYGTVYAVPGQWFAVPIKLEGQTLDGTSLSYVSINPDENWNSSDALYFRTTPNQQLPRLIYRAATGQAQTFVGVNGFDLQLGNPGAPIFDPSFGVPRLLADSVVMRIVFTGFTCDENTNAFRTDEPVSETVTLTFDGDSCDMTSNNPLSFSDGAGNTILIDQMRRVTDKEFAEDPIRNSAQITNMWLESVMGGWSDINCDGDTDYVVTEDGIGIPLYEDLSGTVSGQRYTEGAVITSGAGAYQLWADGFHADLAQNPHDPNASAGKQVIVSSNLSTATLVTNGTGTPKYRVRPINADWRFVSEIWLDEFQYRGHRLVSAADRVWYTPDPSRETGRRPDVAYSLLYRDRGNDGGPQYIVFTYALRAASTKGDYVPPEQKNDIAQGRSPLRLARDVKLGFDDELLKYYIEAPRNTLNEWLAQPGQVLMFAGDPTDPSMPFNGADAPVEVQFRRGIRGYLASPPRVGNRSLLDLASTDRFDIWAVQPSVKSLDGSEWGLRPIEARVFETFDN